MMRDIFLLEKIKSQKEVFKLIFEDKYGRILIADEIDEFSAWEIEEKGIHVSSMEV